MRWKPSIPDWGVVSRGPCPPRQGSGNPRGCRRTSPVSVGALSFFNVVSNYGAQSAERMPTTRRSCGSRHRSRRVTNLSSLSNRLAFSSAISRSPRSIVRRSCPSSRRPDSSKLLWSFCSSSPALLPRSQVWGVRVQQAEVDAVGDRLCEPRREIDGWRLRFKGFDDLVLSLSQSHPRQQEACDL